MKKALSSIFYFIAYCLVTMIILVGEPFLFLFKFIQTANARFSFACCRTLRRMALIPLHQIFGRPVAKAVADAELQALKKKMDDGEAESAVLDIIEQEMK